MYFVHCYCVAKVLLCVDQCFSKIQLLNIVTEYLCNLIVMLIELKVRCLYVILPSVISCFNFSMLIAIKLVPTICNIINKDVRLAVL